MQLPHTVSEHGWGELRRGVGYRARRATTDGAGYARVMQRLQHRVLAIAVALLAAPACGDDGGSSSDTQAADTGGEDSAIADTGVSDTSASDTAQPDTVAPDASVADTVEADTTVAGTEQPDTVEPDTTVTDTEQPDTVEADTIVVDTVVADTAPQTCDYGPYGGPVASVDAQAPLPTETTTQGHFTCGDDHELWARINVAEAGWWVVTTDFDIDATCVFPTLTDASFSGVSKGSYVLGRTDALLSAGEDYYLRVFGYEAGSGSEGYYCSGPDRDEAGPFSITASRCADDEHEAADFDDPDIAALVAGPGLSATMCGHGDIDHYRIDVTSAGTLTMTATHAPGDYHQTDLRLYDTPVADPLAVVPTASVEDIGGTGTVSLTHEVTAGTWWLAVWNRGIPTTYTLSISGAAVE